MAGKRKAARPRLGPRSRQPAGRARGKYLFLSYSRANARAVMSLVDRLEAWGYEVWLDQFDLEVGTQWRKTIAGAVRQADAFLLMVSRAAASSAVVRWELTVAEKEGVRILPVVLQRFTLPASLRSRLGDLHQVSLVQNPYRGAARLIEALEGLRGPIPAIPGDMKYPALRSNARRIGEFLRFLQKVTPNGGNVILHGGIDWAYYVQIAVSPDDKDVYGECVGNSNLKRQYRLGEDQLAELRSIGWEAQDSKSAGNLRRQWPASTDRDRALVAGEVMRTFVKAHRHPLGEDLRFELQLNM